MSSVTHAYQQAAVSSADSVQLVIMMHEMMIDDLRRCLSAIHARDIQRRTREAGHALMVLEQLQSSLNLEHGGEAVRTLDRVYAGARVELLRAQANKDPALLEQQIAIFSSLRDAWRKVGSQRVQADDLSDPGLEAFARQAWSV